MKTFSTIIGAAIIITLCLMATKIIIIPIGLIIIALLTIVLFLAVIAKALDQANPYDNYLRNKPNK